MFCVFFVFGVVFVVFGLSGVSASRWPAPGAFPWSYYDSLIGLGAPGVLAPLPCALLGQPLQEAV